MTQPMENKASLPPRPPFWLTLSIPAGNLIQVSGLVIGWLILYGDAHLQAGSALRVILMLAGFLIIYICSHSLGHYAVGRLVGIRFRKYGLRGTDHPEVYPPGFRQLMSILPTFSAVTEKESMAKASPSARALMFAAGETSTTIWSVLVGWVAWRSGLPGGFVLFVFLVVFSILSIVTTAIIPRGDYAKALRAIRQS